MLGQVYGKPWVVLARILAGRLATFALGISLLTTACGVPIAAYELTPTPEDQAGIQIVPVSQSLANSAATPASTVISSLGAAAVASTTASPAATRTATAASTTSTQMPATTPTPGPAGTAPASAALAGTASSLTAAAPPPSGNLLADVLQAVNDYRTSHGLSALRLNANLTSAAGAYARLMADKTWFTCGCDPHTGPDGSTPARRDAAGGYAGLFRGETLAAGQTSGAAAVNAWLASPPHAAILLDPTAVDVGVGYAFNAGDPYRYYWVLETGIP